MAKSVENQSAQAQEPKKKRGRKPGQKNKKKKAKTGTIEYQIFGELLVIDLSNVQIKKVMLSNGSGKETLEHV